MWTWIAKVIDNTMKTKLSKNIKSYHIEDIINTILDFILSLE